MAPRGRALGDPMSTIRGRAGDWDSPGFQVRGELCGEALGLNLVEGVCKWGSGLLKSRLCFLTSKNHKQDYKQRGTTTWG